MPRFSLWWLLLFFIALPVIDVNAERRETVAIEKERRSIPSDKKEVSSSEEKQTEETRKENDDIIKEDQDIALQKEPPIDLFEEMIRLSGYLLVMIALAAIVVRLGKRLRPGGFGGRIIRVIGGQDFAPGVGVRLIRVGQRIMLMGIGKENVSLLAELSNDDLESETCLETHAEKEPQSSWALFR
ncbi:FliO/MopB family protein [Magnetococcales bacterium HHB-1]